MEIGPRSEITATGPSRPGNGTSLSWGRTINGTMHTFTAVSMPDGEKRYFVSRFNGYVGGPAFGCAWTRVHSIIVPAAVAEPAPVPPFRLGDTYRDANGRPFTPTACQNAGAAPGHALTVECMDVSRAYSAPDCQPFPTMAEAPAAPTYHATKYDSAAAEVIAVLSSVSEGFGAEETGDSDAPMGYLALVILDETHDLAFDDRTNYPLGDEAGEVARTYGVTAEDVMGAHIVTTNSQGFVSVETFDSADLARDEYACRAAWFDAWDNVDRDDDWDGIYVCPVIGHGYHNA
jgi:hypothetical protein